jgi:hypothetical protein
MRDEDMEPLVRDIQRSAPERAALQSAASASTPNNYRRAPAVAPPSFLATDRISQVVPLVKSGAGKRCRDIPTALAHARPALAGMTTVD